MKRMNWQIILGISLVVLSVILYSMHYFIFRDPHHIFIYMLGDIAFIPIEVLMVTLIIHRLLLNREKKAMLRKLNMVIGAFFSEVGLKLILSFAKFDHKSDDIKKDLSQMKNWTDADFKKVSELIDNYKFHIDSSLGDLKGLRDFLSRRRNFLLRLIENPNLLEHEVFTELLWAVFHLTEELEYRSDLDRLPHSDLEHISGDIRRAYVLLLSRWIDYVRHLKYSYPYLYSLAVRTNPLDEKASPIVGS
ncbi:MAG TPA: hypothetical protein DCP02_00370 [Actinobacteria bacterium]|nr:hypothetical protein [Actinomycetota bacterium]